MQKCLRNEVMSRLQCRESVTEGPDSVVCSGGGLHLPRPRRMRAARVLPPAEVADESVERWREEQTERRDSQHAKQHRCPERLAHFSASTGGHGQGSDAEDERK